MIRVLLADDHTLVRAGMRVLLSAEDDIEVVGECANGREVLAFVRDPEVCIDVLILDISMPRLNGTETLSRLRVIRPDLPVLVVSMYPEKQYARRMIAAGAAGYLFKGRSEAEVMEAVRAVVSGRLFVQREAASDAQEQSHRFTPREHQIFTLLVSGSTASEIAAELDITLSTVSTHLGRVKDKLGVRSVAGIIAHAHRVGIIT